MRGFGAAVFAAIVLIILWIGGTYHYSVVAEYASTLLEPNAGEAPKVHEKR
jgi:archaellum component FlaF (FlaF/FlaG flagellin family)